MRGGDDRSSLAIGMTTTLVLVYNFDSTYKTTQFFESKQERFKSDVRFSLCQKREIRMGELNLNLSLTLMQMDHS